MRRKTNIEYLVTGILVAGTLVLGTILSSIKVSADTNDTVVDEVNVTVPVACTMNGVVNTAHTATLMNGTYSATTGSDYENGIGKTTLTTFCNDYNGFSIYAIGYTNNTEGTNTLIGQSTGQTINTAVYTNGDTTSSWSMKLTKVTDTSTSYIPNNLTITNNFNNYHTVPTEYTKVAEYHASTGSSATDTILGSKLETTYAAYISNTQVADTYEGKVKYVLVHPYDGNTPVHEDQIGVNYNGNGLTFANGTTKNRVVYGPSCTPMYIATTPGISKTSNINNDGVATGSFDGASSASYAETVTFSGAVRLRVDMAYAVGEDDTWINVWAGSFDYDSEEYDSLYDYLQDVWPTDIGEYTGGAESDGAGGYTYTDGAPLTTSFYVEDESVTIMLANYNESNVGYGYYAQVYPIYSTEQEGTEETSICSGLTNITGTYAETTTWKGKWYITSNNETTFLENEAAVISYLSENESALLGTNVNIYAYNPYAIIYNGNGASAGTMTGFTTTIDTASSTADLMAPNFKRTGYGFAGWSADQNATVNSSSKIYGPNEKITGTDLTFDSSTHETTLYAVWVASAGTMQNWTGCSSLTTGQVTALTDSRDNNVYTVGKLADGNCWMMENLRLDNNATISSSNTNSPISTFTALSATSDSWCTNTNAACYNQSVLNTNNINIGGTNVAGTTLTVAPGRYDGSNWNADVLGDSGNNYQWYGYGNYYNWYSATAGNGTYSTGSDVVASGDICPTGWHLPNGGTGTGTNGGAVSGGFSYLDKQMGGTGSNQKDNDGEEIVSNRWRSYPNNFVYSGGWGGSSAFERGYSGDYWSRTTGNTNAYGLVFYSTYVNPGTAGNISKYGGVSVRCLAQ